MQFWCADVSVHKIGLAPQLASEIYVDFWLSFFNFEVPINSHSRFSLLSDIRHVLARYFEYAFHFFKHSLGS